MGHRVSTGWVLLLGLALGGCRLTPPTACAGPCEAATAGPCASTACAPRDVAPWPAPPCARTYVDASVSFLPNIGGGLGAGRVLRRSASQVLSAEVEGTWQFTDDEAFVDDGNPAAGDWYQVRVGVKSSFAPRSRRHLTLRAGAVWFQANGVPNVVDVPGDYAGLYGGFGFETDLSSAWTIGPELAVFLVTPTNDLSPEAVPQLLWHATWWPGRGSCRPLERAPIGEIYAGASGLLSPGLGAGFEGGQVFLRSRLATYSFEVLAGFQDPNSGLFFTQDGNYGQIRGGGKASFLPCARGHPTARAGLAWVRSTATNDFLDQAGDHVGGYLGLGYEYDLTPHLTTGPELTLLLVARERQAVLQPIPQFSWHVIWRL